MNIYGVFKELKNKLVLSMIKTDFEQKAIADTKTVFMIGASCKNSGPRENITIREHCTIGASFYALCGGKIVVGKNTYIGPGTSLQSSNSIKIGNNVIIANNVIVVDNNNHPTSPEMRMKMSSCKDFMHDELWSWKYAESAPVVIEDNVWIGRDARILKGVTIGRGAIVAMGSIVTKDVDPYTIVAGNPARCVKTIKPDM